MTLMKELQRLQQRCAQINDYITTAGFPSININGQTPDMTQLNPALNSAGTLSGIHSAPLPSHDPLPLPLSGARNLPGLPLRIIQLIHRGLFVPFDSIFAATSHAASARAADRSALFSLAISTDDIGGPSVDVLPRATTARERVNNFHSWSVAFNLFMRCTIHFRPHLADPLIRYQGIIAGFATSYIATAWLSYDIAFRHLVANNPRVPWDRVDEDTFTVHLRSAQGLPRCYICHVTGHMASNCSRRYASPAFRIATTSTPTFTPSSAGVALPAPSLPSQVPRGPAANRGVPICFSWNGRGGCVRQLCRFRHSCSICGDDHPRFACSRSARR